MKKEKFENFLNEENYLWLNYQAEKSKKDIFTCINDNLTNLRNAQLNFSHSNEDLTKIHEILKDLENLKKEIRSLLIEIRSLNSCILSYACRAQEAFLEHINAQNHGTNH